MGPETTTELNTWKPGALGLSCSSVRSEPHGALTAAVQHLLSPPCPSAPSVPGTWPQHFAGLGHQVILAKACGTRPLPAGASPHCQHTRATLTPGRADPTGARWDTQTGVIAEARLKDLTPAMPVIFIKAIPVDRMETKNIYECPVYKTRIRGPTYVWTFNLKTKEKAAKWILAAVALLLQV